MTFGFRGSLGIGVLFVAGMLAAPEGCSSDPAETELGGLGQPCFPGDRCNPGEGLVCLAIANDAGTDGGQCFLQASLEGESDAEPEDGGTDASGDVDVENDAGKT
jgi:hypothetical protein